MSLSTAKYFTDPAHSPQALAAEPGWPEVGHALRVVARGYAVLIVAGLWALFVGWLAADEGWRLPGAALRPPYLQIAVIPGLVILGVVVILGFRLILAGQWRCLMYTPQTESTKEWMYACFSCVLIATALS